MSNGYDIVYNTFEQNDNNLLTSINSDLEITIENCLFHNFYNNVDNIYSNINNNNNKNNTDAKNKKHTNSVHISSNVTKTLKINSSNINNAKYENDLADEVYNLLEKFSYIYNKIISNFYYFMKRQKEHVINYLTDIQNTFITFLNRKTNKTTIAEIFIEKYNLLVLNHPELKNNITVYNELSNDIQDVNKSIWLNVYNKKNDDVNYLLKIKKNEKKENEVDKFFQYILFLFEIETKKYLNFCEIIIKYFLLKFGKLHKIYEIEGENKNNEFLFKIDHKKYIFENIDICEDLLQEIFNMNDVNFPSGESSIFNEMNQNNINEKITDNINNGDKPIIEEENELESSNKNLLFDSKNKIGRNNKIPNSIQKSSNTNNITNNNTNINNNKDSNNTNQTNINNNSNKNNNPKISSKTVTEKIEILFINCLKIIIREDLILKKYIKMVKGASIILQNNQNNHLKASGKMSIANASVNFPRQKRMLNTSISAKSFKKQSLRKTKLFDFRNENIINEDEITQIIKTEKRKYKYRLMFLKSFAIRYNDIISNCYDETYNSMDDWIIMSVRAQNNSLNEFINYLKRELNKFTPNISMNNFQFDTYDIYRRYKVDINLLYEKLNYNYLYCDNVFFNLNKEKEKEREKEIKDENKKDIDNEDILINEEDMNYSQLFIYNLNDLMYIYYYIKSFGVDSCNYLVKFDIVKEILIHQFFTKKKYIKINNTKIKYRDSNDPNLNDSTKHYTQEYNSNTLNISSALNDKIENSKCNNGICKKIKFSSNENYSHFLNVFVTDEGKYININELFTCLLILGSKLITSKKFLSLIKDDLPEDKKDPLYFLYNEEEFLKINLWFEKDDYLNLLSDKKEVELYVDITKFYVEGENNNKEMNEKPFKINKIKHAIFEINCDDGKFDFNKIVNMLDKINKYVRKNEEEKNKEEIKNNKEVVTEGLEKETKGDKLKETESKMTVSNISEVEANKSKKSKVNEEQNLTSNENNCDVNESIFNAVFSE